MTPAITIIRSSMVNCYLLKTGGGYALVDSGFSWQRRALRKALEGAGCGPGQLKLIVITHADFDHTGNCAWLRKKYGAPVAIHRAEATAVEKGRMFLSRKNPPGRFSRALVCLMGLLVFRRFKADLFIADGDDLSGYALNARVFHIPGHSTGSIGVLTAEGDFFCGDLLATRYGKPEKVALVDDAGEMEASIRRLMGLDIKTFYPGHGRPFAMAEYTEANVRGGRPC